MKTLFFLFAFSSLVRAQYIDFDSSRINSDTTFSKVIDKDSLRFIFSFKMELPNQNDSLNNTGPRSMYRVDISKPGSRSIFQTIRDTFYYPSTDWRSSGFFDMNFDNYSDLFFVIDKTMHHDDIYSVWLYDIESGLFIHEPAYSDLCCSMYFDTTKSEILIDYVNSTITEMESSVYRIADNKPKLYLYKTTRIFKEEGKCFRHNQTFKLINDELELINDYIEDADDDECINL